MINVDMFIIILFIFFFIAKLKIPSPNTFILSSVNRYLICAAKTVLFYTNVIGCIL